MIRADYRSVQPPPSAWIVCKKGLVGDSGRNLFSDMIRVQVQCKAFQLVTIWGRAAALMDCV